MPNIAHDRRSFLKRSAIVAGTAALGAAAPCAAVAIDPVQRESGEKFKFSLAAYSFRELLTGREPQMMLDDFVDVCAAMGLEGTELTSYYFPPEPTTEYLCGLKRHCFRMGLDVSGTAVGNDFCDPPGEVRRGQIEGVKRWIERASVLGAPVIRIFSGETKPHQSPEDAHRLAVEGIEECCAYAGEFGIHLALENHGGLTTTVEGMLALVNDVQSPWFGVNLDTGNFYSDDIYGDLAKLAPYAINVQVKVAIRPGRGEPAPTDFERLASILRDAAYRGYVVLEYEEDEDPRTACPRYMGELRAAFA